MTRCWSGQGSIDEAASFEWVESSAASAAAATIVTLAKRIFLTTCCSALALTGGTRAEVVVRVNGGLIRGAEPTLRANGAVFKGIPFAQPPVGSLRWREPQPAAGWIGTRDATRYGPACMQNPLGTGVFLAPLAKLYGRDYRQQKIDMSEDCLYLKRLDNGVASETRRASDVLDPWRIECHGERRRKLLRRNNACGQGGRGGHH